MTMIASVLIALMLLAQPPQKQDRPERPNREVNRGKPDSARVERPGMPSRRDSARVERPDSVRGAAYGAKKDTLTGREFGRLRSEEARARVTGRADSLEARVAESEVKVAEARERITQAKARVDRKERERRGSRAEIAEDRRKIAQAEARLAELEVRLAAQRARLDAVKGEE